jgi:hypothetical protein
MSTLTDDQVKEIAKNAVADHGVPVMDVVLTPSIASTGEPALEIKYILPPGSVLAGSSRRFFGDRFSGDHEPGGCQRQSNSDHALCRLSTLNSCRSRLGDWSAQPGKPIRGGPFPPPITDCSISSRRPQPT